MKLFCLCICKIFVSILDGGMEARPCRHTISSVGAEEADRRSTTVECTLWLVSLWEDSSSGDCSPGTSWQHAGSNTQWSVHSPHPPNTFHSVADHISMKSLVLQTRKVRLVTAWREGCGAGRGEEEVGLARSWLPVPAPALHRDTFLAELQQGGVTPDTGLLLRGCEQEGGTEVSLVFPWLHLTDTPLDIKVWLRRQASLPCRPGQELQPSPPPPVLCGSLGRHGNTASAGLLYPGHSLLQATYSLQVGASSGYIQLRVPARRRCWLRRRWRRRGSSSVSCWGSGPAAPAGRRAAPGGTGPASPRSTAPSAASRTSR